MKKRNGNITKINTIYSKDIEKKDYVCIQRTIVKIENGQMKIYDSAINPDRPIGNLRNIPSFLKNVIMFAPNEKEFRISSDKFLQQYPKRKIIETKQYL